MKKIFGNLKFVTKISLLSFNYITFILVISVLAISALWTVNVSLNKLNNERLKSIYELQEAQSNIRDISTWMVASVLVTDADFKKDTRLQIEESVKDLQIHMDNYTAFNHSKADNEEIDKLKEIFEQFQSVNATIMDEQIHSDPGKITQLMESEVSSMLEQINESF